MSSDAAAMSPDAPLFLTHAISKTDSLTTIAVKYGVTIRDVKRANGGMITDATLHARASVRIPRTALAEGSPLPGGGGLTGATKPKTGSAALEEMREHYGTSARARAGSSADVADAAASAGATDGADATRAFAGGAQVATRLKRVGSGAALSEAAGGEVLYEYLVKSATRDASLATGGTRAANHGGGVSAATFHGRDRALMSPPTTRTASGAAVSSMNARVSDDAAPKVPSEGQSSLFPGGGGVVRPRAPPGANVVAGFFARARRGAESLAAFGPSGDARTSAPERKGKGD